MKEEGYLKDIVYLFYNFYRVNFGGVVFEIYRIFRVKKFMFC